MSTLTMTSRDQSVVLDLGPLFRTMTDDEFFELCQRNPDLRIERTSGGDLVIMPPTGGETGRRNFVLTGTFFSWAESDATGVGFDSSTGFKAKRGALILPLAPAEWFERALAHHGLHEIAVSGGIAGSSTLLPPIHRDPCDRTHRLDGARLRLDGAHAGPAHRRLSRRRDAMVRGPRFIANAGLTAEAARAVRCS